MKQKTELLISYFLLAFFVAGAVAIFAAVIIWGNSVPKTALLWNNGAVSGWIQILALATIYAGFGIIPALIVFDEIETIKK